MNRRGFLGLLAGAAAAPSVLLEPVRTIILPPAGGWPVDLRFKASERFAASWTDPRAVVGGNRLVPWPELVEELRKGLNDVFAREYAGFGLAPVKAEGHAIWYDPHG